MRLKFLHRLMAIVDQGEPRRFSSSVLCPETEAGDLVFVGFVELGEFLAEFVFGDIGSVGVEDIAVDEMNQKSAYERFESNLMG